MNTDDKIRAILRAEAETVDPSPAGWDAIRHGIAARQRRGWLFRGTALAGAALTVAGALFVLTRDGRPQGIEQPPATSESPTVTPSASASASPAPTAVVADQTPINAIWPLTTRGEVAAWEADRETYPSLATVNGSALGFARAYLGLADATVASLDARDGSFNFEVRRFGDLVVTVLELRGFGAGGAAPYVVVAARNDALQMTSPESRAVLSSPLSPHGTYHDVDPSIMVHVRADDGGSQPVELADAHADTGPPNDWNATLSFTTTARTGSVLVTNDSKRDGIGAATAVPVTFGAANGGTAAPHVAIHDGRIAYYDNGVRYLTAQEPGGGVVHPDLSPDGKRVAWEQGEGTCASSVRVAPVTGGAQTTVTYDAGTVAMPAWLGSDKVAYITTDCADTSRRHVYVRDLGTGTSRALTTIGDAFAFSADPRGRAIAWASPGTTATPGTITTYVLSNGARRTVAPSAGCYWAGVDVVDVTPANAPVLMTASLCGTALRIERFAVGAPDRDRVADLAVDADSFRVEVADGAILVSHWGGDPAPYVQAIGRDGTVTRFEDRWDASW